MKRTILLLILLCVLTTTVSASYIPENVVSENRDGRQLIVKTYTLSPDDDPSELAAPPFDLEGYTYHHLETVKHEQTYKDVKLHTEVITLETDTNDLSAILEQLTPTVEYSKDGYSGTLTLDHTTIQTQAAGYTAQTYTISDTKQFPNLDRNDPSYIPTTTVKNGMTLSLRNLSWAVTGTGLADDTLVPTSYTATATYTTTGSRKVATGYVTTANYVGEVTAEGIQSIVYTVTYLGVPTETSEKFSPFWLLMLMGLVLLAGAGVTCFVCFRPNASIYAMNTRGIAYKKLGQQKISARAPKLDLTRLKEYPAGAASVELTSKLAHKLSGRIITIQLFGGSRTHLVEPNDGSENYWFAIEEEEKQ